MAKRRAGSSNHHGRGGNRGKPKANTSGYESGMCYWYICSASLWVAGWGFVGLSGWLPLAEEVQRVMNVPGREQDVLKMPVLLQHCKDDDVVPVEHGNDLRKLLEEIGMCVRWECFEQGGHWLNEPRGMDGLVEFIQSVLRTTSGRERTQH
ncbi:hypothetical protein IG631_11973 [Alternaria alternata]|nr:hypothetical protein IG631_11973 [Alternaria alternata]